MNGAKRQIIVIALVGLAIVGQRRDAAPMAVSCASQRLGPRRVSVFTWPASLSVGTLDISTMVEETGTGSIAHDVTISLEAQHLERGTTLRATATTSAATNKLFQAATLELAAAGRWEITVTVARGSETRKSLRFPVEIAEGLMIRSALAPWVAWPIVPIALYAVHQWLACRRQRTRPQMPGSQPNSLLVADLLGAGRSARS